MRTTVTEILDGALASLLSSWGLDGIPAYEVEVPRMKDHGDLATNVAMLLAKPLKRAPRQIAEEIRAAVLKADGRLQSVEVAGPGFINFRFGPGFWHEQLSRILRDDKNYLHPDLGGGERVQVEFVSANPTGPLHVGHGRGAAIGSALANLLAAAGFRVEREFYINDAGRQIRMLGESLYARYQQLLCLDVPFPEEGYHGGYVEELAEAFFHEFGDRYKGDGCDACAETMADWAYRRMLEEQRADLQDFNVVFDEWKSEAELLERGAVDAAFTTLKDKGLLYEKDGALWFRSENFGDEKDRVVVKADGQKTYFASDIAYHREKLQRGYDRIVDIWGADHHGYVPRVSAAIQAFGLPKEKFQVVLVQMVTLLRHGQPVSMSKRAGTFVTLREVIDEVGSDIARFIFLTRRPDSQLDFDLDLAKEQSAENPVYYVQYAHARIQSIFRTAAEQGIGEAEALGADTSVLQGDDDLSLIKKLAQYPDVFAAAARAMEPHRITFFLQELASEFHGYYHRNRVLVEERPLALARLALCLGVRAIFQEGLTILGVAAPEKM